MFQYTGIYIWFKTVTLFYLRSLYLSFYVQELQIIFDVGNEENLQQDKNKKLLKHLTFLIQIKINRSVITNSRYDRNIYHDFPYRLHFEHLDLS